MDPAGMASFLGNGLRFVARGDRGLDRAEVLADASAPGATLLRVLFPAGSASPAARRADHRSAAGGAQAYLALPGGPCDSAVLQYAVRFGPGFAFVKGGKLPGLYGGTATGGRRIPDGTDGFSTRYMWRAGGAGEVYAYLPTSTRHGTSLGRGRFSFTPGRWTTLRQHVRLDRPGHDDGRIVVEQDGRPVLDARGLRFRTDTGVGIDGLFLSTFFGGGDPSWASPTDQHVDLAGFTIAAGESPAAATRTGGSPCA